MSVAVVVLLVAFLSMAFLPFVLVLSWSSARPPAAIADKPHEHCGSTCSDELTRRH